jgi:hypothetical protein
MNPEFECECCGKPLNENGHCINIDCKVAQDQAAQGAARSTRKATTLAAANNPRAFTSSGRVD